MSIEASNAVWKHSRSRGAERLVMLCLANYTNGNGIAWPTFTTISRDTGVSERQVSRAVISLADKGELQIVEKGDGRGRSTVYRITIKDDMVSTFGGLQKDDMVSEKVDISSIKVDTVSIKVDTLSPHPIEPLNNHYEPLEEPPTPKPEPNPFPFKPSRKNPDPSPADLRAQTIADVCGLKMSIPAHGRKCDNAAAQLNEFTAEYIRERYTAGGWWFTSDWRGKQGQPPTPEQIVLTISVVNSAPSSNGANGHGYKRPEINDPTMPKPGQGGVW